MRHVAIIMGDLVGSERAPSIATLHSRFNEAVLNANRQFADSLLSPLTITLGDEFQGIPASLSVAFDIASAIRLFLLADKIECRFVVGQANIATPINPDRAWNMMGHGLGTARDKLNDKSMSNLYRFSLPHDPVQQLLLDTIGDNQTEIERAWTDTQRNYVTDALHGHATADLAKRTGITATAIYKTLRAANYRLYQTNREAIGFALTALDQRREAA